MAARFGHFGDSYKASIDGIVSGERTKISADQWKYAAVGQCPVKCDPVYKLHSPADIARLLNSNPRILPV